MTKLLTAFLSTHPYSNPTVCPMRPYLLPDALLSHKIDCAFLVPVDLSNWNQQLNFTPLCKQRLCAVMAKDHPLAGQKELYPEQLRGYTA